MKPEALAAAYEKSRRKFIVQEDLLGQQKLLAVLRLIFTDSRRETWTKEEILELLDNPGG